MGKKGLSERNRELIKRMLATEALTASRIVERIKNRSVKVWMLPTPNEIGAYLSSIGCPHNGERPAVWGPLP